MNSQIHLLLYKQRQTNNHQQQTEWSKQIANIIKDKVKTLENTQQPIDIVSWASKNIIIDLDLDKIEAKIQIFELFIRL